MNVIALRAATSTTAFVDGAKRLWNAMRLRDALGAQMLCESLLVDGSEVEANRWLSLCEVISGLGPLERESTYPWDPTSLSPAMRRAIHPEANTSDRIVLAEAVTPNGLNASFGFLVDESGSVRSLFDPTVLSGLESN
ncbi:MAG: hypothetical protein AAF658_08915 [Myxococcota bacterium]